MISLCPAPFRLPVLATAAFLMGSTRGTATQIIWDTLIDRPHATSAGQPLPATTIFLLGVFDREFTPTAANRTEWAQRWHTASIARWDPATRYFSGEVNFTSNPIPFTSGNAAWVWGIAGSEWILLRRSTWNWPTGSPLGGPPIFWTANSSVTTAAGSVTNPGTTDFFYRTENAGNHSPPILRWTDWQKLHFSITQLANPAISGPAADPDGDGVPNISEYAGMSWPLLATSLPQLISEPGTVSSAAGRHLSLRFSCDPRAALALSPESSPDLQQWDASPSATVVLPSTTPGSFLFRAAARLDASPRSYLRLRLNPAPP
jgi:hypothetical protein